MTIQILRQSKWGGCRTLLTKSVSFWPPPSPLVSIGSGVSLMAHSMRDPVWLETNQSIWQNLERRDCFLLTLSRHQNIETSQYTISKNGWVLSFFVILTPVTKKLQFTVFLDHPVLFVCFLFACLFLVCYH